MDDFFSPPSSDPASDFLAREAAAGIDDFGASHAGTFDHDFEASASAFPDLDGGDDGLGGFAAAPTSPPSGLNGATGAGAFSLPPHQVSVTNDNEFAAFENEYPEIEVPPVVPAMQNNGFGGAPVYQQPPSVFQGTPAPIEEDSEFIKGWKVKQAEEIARREEASKAKKEETIIKARNAIDNFYQEYNSKKEKNMAKNKEEEAAFNAERTDARARGTTWDRMCAVVDLQDSRSKTGTKSKQDLTRFKEILLALKREGDTAPGAGGY